MASLVTACADEPEEGDMLADDPAAVEPAPGAPGAPAAGGAAAALVAQGREVYSGPGICFTCHGPDAQGTPLAPNLTDGQWLWIENPEVDLHAKLVASIRAGVPQPREYPAPMPPMGGASLTDEQLEAVAAYIVTLNQ